jgi:hypothetical protein
LEVSAVWACLIICAVMAVACSILAAMRIRFLLDMQELKRGKKH